MEQIVPEQAAVCVYLETYGCQMNVADSQTVTAMRGCDRFWTFCVGPYVRGRERSLPPDAILREVQGLAARGVKEIVLLGQTVNAYRFDSTDFGALLKLIAGVEGIERIRFTS